MLEEAERVTEVGRGEEREEAREGEDWGWEEGERGEWDSGAAERAGVEWEGSGSAEAEAMVQEVAAAGVVERVAEAAGVTATAAAAGKLARAVQVRGRS